MRPIQTALLALLLSAIPGRIFSDTVYPSRLEIKEVEPGVFDVRFNLAVVGGMRVRAEPVLPSVFVDLEQPRVQRTQFEYAEFRKVTCPTDSLFGQTVAIRGLVGTQVDVILFVELLDGRNYTATLKPTNAAYEIPHPPGVAELLLQSSTGGSREALQSIGLAMLIVVALVLIRERLELGRATVSIVSGYAIGIPLAGENLIQIPDALPPLALFAAALLPVLALLKGDEEPGAVVRPLWVMALVIGLMIGGTLGSPSWSSELSHLERNLSHAFRVVGFALGVTLTGILVEEFRWIAKAIMKESWARVERVGLGYIVGTLSVAGILYGMSALAARSALVPSAPASVYVLALVMGVWIGTLSTPFRFSRGSLLVFALGAGMFLGQTGVTLPFESLLVDAGLFAVGLGLVTARLSRPRMAFGIMLAATLALAWSASAQIREDLSYPLAVSAGSALAATFGCMASRSVARLWNLGASPIALRALAAVVILFVLAQRIAEYVEWYTGSVSTEMAMGFVRVPLLALGFLVAALLAWPRKRKIQELLNLTTRKPVLHWAFLIAAFFTIPIGSFRARNIFFEPEAPSGDIARHILTQVLSNTYQAFNLRDEEELYDQLSRSVTGNLVADVYLDSRRKLTSGVRQGAQVDVREVRVQSIDGFARGTNAQEGYAYDVTWSVTARVSHLQHVHYRQNVYAGEVTVVSDGETWKISQIALRSEDRIVIPWSAG